MDGIGMAYGVCNPEPLAMASEPIALYYSLADHGLRRALGRRDA
jgi:hypothetical protein